MISHDSTLVTKGAILITLVFSELFQLFSLYLVLWLEKLAFDTEKKRLVELFGENIIIEKCLNKIYKKKKYKG